ncbi:MAG: CYTH domain-containing protein [Lachnospirales bacterium]
MEIERKFLVQKLPLEAPLGYVEMEQGYISTDPVIRIRRQKTGEEESFVLTIKGGGLVMREEYELALDRAQFEGLRSKCTGRIITKIRYRYALSDGLIAEVDVFGGEQQGLILAEVEFSDEQSMLRFKKPDWFGKDVSQDIRYHNSYMSMERRNGES